MNLDQQLVAYTQALDDGDEDRANAILAAVNAEDEATHARLTAPDALANAARWYAAQGVRIFPLKPGDKVPATRNGFKDATTDPEQVAAWWARTPQANIGLPTGITFDVVDIDGPTGYASLSELGVPDHLGSALTPRGRHYYITPMEGRGNKAALKPGIDYRGAGGYVVAPPSRRSDGGIYRWVDFPQFMVASAT
jgi:hypothetical protein